MTGLAAVVASGLATLPDDFKGRRNPELLADGSDLRKRLAGLLLVPHLDGEPSLDTPNA